ncbi:oxidoreductase [uncultured Tateyamaria sp.]|uniref:oxidoreductase n=1 Tax=uncultured Tateyamaria sp. TaxID=455651 RepID=UPI002629CC32|nr:oxidoreductase [uncultured Tateyamaria sp.]
MMNALKTAAALVALSVTPSLAQDIVLTISGAVDTPDSGTDWTFNMDSLQSMTTTTFETTTIWTEGVQTFQGVSLKVLLDRVGAQGDTLRAVALNDYAVTIPKSDAVIDGPIVAYMRNGADMSVRDKGPLWIVYPYDANETYKSEEYYSRSIWQLAKLEVVAAQ